MMLVGYMIYNENQNLKYQRQKAIQDSIAQATAPHQAPVSTSPDTAARAAVTRVRDSAELSGRLGNFAASARGNAQTSTLENQLARIDFTSKGGRPSSILLKKFKTFNGNPLLLMHGSYEDLSLDFYTSSGQLIQTGDLYFQAGPVQTLADGSQSVSYRLDAGGPGRYLEYVYTIHPGSYMVDFDIRMKGMDQVIRNDSSSVSMRWQGQGDHQENDLKRERNLTQIYYRNTQDQTDFFNLYKTSQKTLSEPLQWISFKQEFFNITFIPKKPFTSATVNGSIPDSGDVVSRASFGLGIPFDHTASFDYPTRLFLGPNDYNILKSYDLGLQNLIQLGYGIFAFVKYINIGFIIPLFTFFSRFVRNYGVIIIIMTLFIRIILSPLTYKSYVSAAKMKVLKPELDELHKKFPDQQKFGVEQMKLFRTAGVSPLGGCLPTLLQLPILYAMYDFFPSSIELRQQAFLWCKDLSTYDSIWTFPNHFSIPAYGDHISLFTILMTATSIFLALYNKNMTDQSNPMLKWMPYIFPIILLGVFNNLAAALTFYYFLSNLISIGLQWVIQTYIIDEKKIHKQIQENKKKPAKKSKWAERLEQAQKMQQPSSQQRIQPRKGK